MSKVGKELQLSPDPCYVRSVTQITPSPYLTGWHFNINYVETGGFDGFGETGIDQFIWAITQGKDKIDSHFIKSNMGHPGKVAQTLTEYVYHIGSTSGKSNEVKADNLSYADAYTLDGEKVTIKRVVHAASVLYESAANTTLKGKIDTSVTIQGDITAKRKGPSPKEDSFQGTLKDNEIELKNIPFGDYTFAMTTKCQCPIDLGDFVYESASAQADFSVADEKIKATITIDVVDAQMVPLQNKSIEIEQEACLDQGSGGNSAIFSESGSSDDLGEVTFEHMPVGDYKVSVDGKYVRTIHFCQTGSETVIVDSKWYLKSTINAVSPFGSGSMVIKNFKYDCKGAAYDQYGKTCAAVYDDSTDVSLSYSGSIAKDTSLSPMILFEHGLQLTFMYRAANADQGRIDINKLGMVDGFNGSLCMGTWKDIYSDDLKKGKAFDITITGGVGTCEVEFKPCTEELCKQFRPKSLKIQTP